MELLTEAHVYLALSHLGLNDPDAAKESLKELLRWDRTVELDSGEYDRSLTDLFEEAKAEVENEPAIPDRKSNLTWVLLGAGGAGAGAALALSGGAAEDPLAVDNDGDGFSENQGDCDDTSSQVRPNGGFDFTIDPFAFMGVVECSMKNLSQQVYRVTNNDCQSLTIRSLRVDRPLRVGPFGVSAVQSTPTLPERESWSSTRARLPFHRERHASSEEVFPSAAGGPFVVATQSSTCANQR